MSEELKPCPFCGGLVSSIIITSPVEKNIPRKQARICLICDARGPEHVPIEGDDSIKSWNIRKENI